MLVRKSITFRGLMTFSGHHLIWLSSWAIIAALLHMYTPLREVAIPWLPLSVIGTAVAFYVGFKNNQSYDRLWEARKIWGAIVNSSRSWGSEVNHFITDTFRDQNSDAEQLLQHKQRLIYRHIAWLYTLRNQLLLPTQWEHASLDGAFGRWGKRNIEKFGVGLFIDEDTITKLSKYLSQEEFDTFPLFKNTATQLIDQQAGDLARLRSENFIDDFRHMELQKVLSEFYDHQGKAERIKKFPLPRLYANISFIFVCIFVFLLPFGLMGEFSKLGDVGVLISVPLVIIIGWIYVNMEMVGDYSENPFEGSYNDIPMLSLCRTIEIDLLEMLREKDIPKPIDAVNGILM